MIYQKIKYLLFFAISLVSFTMMVASCARMGAPDGGWYDERPPRVVGASPADRELNVDKKRVRIYFSEFIKMDNASEKVVVSPPQKEQPEFKVHGRYIQIELQDSLKPDMTYTVDFSDAISDNNEGNPLGSYTYTFSTGNEIDTMEVSGYVLNAEDLEPVKGILVGLYPAPDSSIVHQPSSIVHPNDSLPPFLRVARSDSRGHFVIRGVKDGKYTVGALQDADGDYRFNQLSEMMAYSHDVITTSVFTDHRQDTIWADKDHVKDILITQYQHFLPDNVVLRCFMHSATDRNFLKFDRTEANHFTLFFTAPCHEQPLPRLTLLNAPEGCHWDSSYLLEASEKADTLTYWLKDTMLVNQDTLRFEMQTLLTDTLGNLQPQTDTLEILAKQPYEKRLKALAKQIEDWKESQEKKLKKAEKYNREHPDEKPEMVDTVWKEKALEVKYHVPASLSPDGELTMTFPTPMEKIDTAAIHLYVEQDSLWYRSPFVVEAVEQKTIADNAIDTVGAMRNKGLSRQWHVYTDWIPGAQYSFEIDSLAFRDIYGKTSAPYKSGLKVRTLNDFGSLFVNVTYPGKDSIIVQLVSSADKVEREALVQDGTAEFYYITPATYYLKAFIDSNGNGVWDTGDYYLDKQPEEVYYNPTAVECKAKWDLTRDWNLTALPLYKQKPEALVKQKADKENTIKHRNAERAAQKGVPVPAKWQ